jgi:CMP-N-acetylneuraminic acid synthetase
MTAVAIITAKGGNQSIQDKNIINVCGKPILYYPIKAAKEASLIDDVFISTECSKIKAVAKEYGVKIIDRPEELAQPDTNHGDVIVHAARFVKTNFYSDLEIVTILLGNTVMISGDIIDITVKKLYEDSSLDSCMTVWKAQDDHPYRAMMINRDGYLESFLKDLKVDINRQSYPDVYFYDQGPWTIRYDTIERCVKTKEGPGPWWWMGKKSLPVERLWVTGRDIHSELDVAIAEWWAGKERFNTEYLFLSYEHFENALRLLREVKTKGFVSRFYYGIVCLLNTFRYDLKKGRWHDKERYLDIFKGFEALEKIWESFKALRYAADYGYYQGKKWDDYEEEFWNTVEQHIERLTNFMANVESQEKIFALIKYKLEEIKVWIGFIKKNA